MRRVEVKREEESSGPSEKDDETRPSLLTSLSLPPNQKVTIRISGKVKSLMRLFE